MLKANHLVKKYKARTVVNDVCLEVAPSQVVGLLGPNGAGKTTTFYMIAGLLACDSGSIILDGIDVTHIPIHRRAQKGLGYLPQEPSIFRKLTTRENILAILELNKRLSATQRQQQCNALLQEFHLNTVADTLGLSLSGGERRRVEIARALASNPKLILLDEPFAGVDPISVIDIKLQIRHLAQRGIAILITDHNVRETLDICDRAYILNQGQVLATGSPQHIVEHSEVRAIYLGENFEL